MFLGASVKCLTLAQVVISQFVGFSPMLGSVHSSEPEACFGFCVSLSNAPPPLALSLKKKKKKKSSILKWMPQASRYPTCQTYNQNHFYGPEFYIQLANYFPRGAVGVPLGICPLVFDFLEHQALTSVQSHRKQYA